MREEKKSYRAKLRENKKLHRKYLTWLRMVQYGVHNFTRNAWLTTAATAVMTITLLIVFTTLAARTMLNDTVTNLREEINLAIFLKSDINDRTVKSLSDQLASDDNVKQVRFISSEEGRDIYIEENLDPNDAEGLNTLAEAEVAFPAKFDINVENPDKLGSIEEMLQEENFASNLFPGAEQLDGDKRSAVKTISSWAETADRVGLSAAGLFIAISMLIIFNTIRMAIFTRRDEIEMMKLIGADKGFIRGPFVVEAVMYGVIAAILATAIGYFILQTFRQNIADAGISVDGLSHTLMLFMPLVVIAMMLFGSLIGNISSRLAVRRYLKV